MDAVTQTLTLRPAARLHDQGDVDGRVGDIGAVVRQRHHAIIGELLRVVAFLACLAGWPHVSRGQRVLIVCERQGHDVLNIAGFPQDLVADEGAADMAFDTSNVGVR